ncbi:MAG: FAD-dependent monooxygenase [Planctomycetes bacterium]|nr:FAD-dependent monooxygenase [Planctomycetota bacterium]
MRSLRIGIVGCGTAGPAVAAILARGGHAVTILERAPELHPVGAGLLIQPTGMHVLQHLGLLDDLLTLGSRIHRLDGRTATGRHILDLAYADLAPHLFGLGLHRGALFAALLGAATRAGADVRVGCTVESIKIDGDAVKMVDSHTNSHGPFDLVIVADGAKSALRQYAPHHRVKRYPWGALWFVADRRGTTFDHTLSQVYRSTDRMIGFLPSGRPRARAADTISVFWSLPYKAHDRFRAAGLDAWRREALELAPHATELLQQVQSLDECVFASYFDSSMRPCYLHDAPVVFLGDAAHAMSPQLGQGANLALVDALELAQCLSSESSVRTALHVYDQQRAAHIGFYSRASRWLTPWFQSDLTPLAWPRDVLMHPLSRVPWIRKQMLQSLAGVKDGVFSVRAELK